MVWFAFDCTAYCLLCTVPCRAAQPETGLMVWDAARVLCRLVENQHPVTFEGMHTACV